MKTDSTVEEKKNWLTNFLIIRETQNIQVYKWPIFIDEELN